MTSRKLKTNLCGLLAIFFFATSFPLSRIALEYFGPYTLGFLRCIITGLLFAIVGICNKIKIPRKPRDILLLLLSGAAGFGLYLFFFNKGIQTITSATSSIISSTSPLMVAGAAAFFYKEKISVIGVFALVTAFCGVLIMILWAGIFSINVGVVWTFIAALLAAAYSLLNRALSRIAYGSIEIVTYSMLFGALVLAPVSMQSVHEVMQADARQLAVLLLLSVFPSGLGYFFLSKGIQIAEKTTEVTNYIFAMPLLATMLGYVMLGETLNSGTVIGGLLIVTGITLFVYKGAAKS